MSSLDRTLANLNSAEEAGAAAEAKLKAQNELLKTMLGNTDEINEGLDDSQASMSRMEAGYISSKITGLKNTLGISTPKLGKKDEDMKTFTAEGWLQKRGPAYGYSWENRWCKLLEDTLAWYVDSDCKDKKGCVPITCRTRLLPFADSAAPGDAHKHRRKMPYGFVLDSDPEMGNRRRLFYFNASCDSEVKSWAEEIEKAAKALELKANDEDKMSAKPQSKLDEVNSTLDVLKDRAVAINREAQKQNGLIKEVSAEADKTRKRIDEMRARTKKI
mmetsp:Transcript_49489/g.115761  ORF Transcript_49489/g.115761 Transcript_49489/m.115761 type:complete len:274 (-) Transcript_49489:71-892(-)